MQKVNVPVSNAYDVLIGENLLVKSDEYLSPFIANRLVMIVTDQNLDHHHYPEKLENTIENLTLSIDQITLPPGEEEKSLKNVEKLLRTLADKNYSRNDVLIALGGGVIGDLVGFVASIYLRGIDFIQIPTTLLAAIDSSVGGKTAVDLPEGKNLVGAFYHPQIVLCDTTTFKTLEKKVFEDGCSELIKYGMIMSPLLLQQLIERTKPLNAASKDLEDIIRTCVQMKTDIVVEDEKDKGLRQLLNYGHTLGHALEQISGYQISHGRAIALGQSFMLRLAVDHHYIENDFSESFDDLLKQYHLLEEKPDYSMKDLEKAMKNDKKIKSDDITLVIPVEFGKADLFSFSMDTFLSTFDREWKRYEIND